jgi:hypothetical protein
MMPSDSGAPRPNLRVKYFISVKYCQPTWGVTVIYIAINSFCYCRSTETAGLTIGQYTCKQGAVPNQLTVTTTKQVCNRRSHARWTPPSRWMGQLKTQFEYIMMKCPGGRTPSEKLSEEFSLRLYLAKWTACWGRSVANMHYECALLHTADKHLFCTTSR